MLLEFKELILEKYQYVYITMGILNAFNKKNLIKNEYSKGGFIIFIICFTISGFIYRL
jgi:hypothetical protein